MYSSFKVDSAVLRPNFVKEQSSVPHIGILQQLFEKDDKNSFFLEDHDDQTMIFVWNMEDMVVIS